MLLRYWKNLYLNWRKPCRESAGKMLDQNSDKTLDRSECNTVDHDRAVLLSISPGVLQVKTLRHLHVKLDGSALPCPSDGIFQMEVDLWPIECAVSFIYHIIKPQIIQSAS